jgi:hypothetical protein
MSEPDDTQIEQSLEGVRPRAGAGFREGLRAHLARDGAPDQRPRRLWIAVAGALATGVALLALAAAGIPV